MRQAVVVLYYEGGSYSLPVQQVEAGQTFEVEIKRLRDEQIPDGFGNLIPAEVDKGQVRWFGRGELGQFIGRLVQYNPATGTSSSFSCPTPCPCEPSYDRGEIQGGPIQGSPGNRFFIRLIDVVKDCNGFTDRYPVQDPNANVTSSSPLTASVSGPFTTQFGGLEWQVTLGNQGGAATIRGSWTGVKWRLTCLGPSLISNCSEFRCTFSYAVGSASTTATVTTTSVRIKMGGTDITNTTRDVIVGQKISLIAEVQPAGQQTSNQQWTVPGNPIANYVANTTQGMVTPLTNLTNSAIDFYWVSGGDGRQVQYSVSVNGQPFTARATFNVKRPTASVTSTTGIVEVSSANGSLELHYGRPGTQGIVWNAAATLPQGFNGTFVWVQIAHPNRRRRLTTTGTWERAVQAGLDGGFPYPVGNVDSPGTALNSNYLEKQVNNELSRLG